MGILKPAYNAIDMVEVELLDDGSEPRQFADDLLMVNIHTHPIKLTSIHVISIFTFGRCVSKSSTSKMVVVICWWNSTWTTRYERSSDQYKKWIDYDVSILHFAETCVTAEASILLDGDTEYAVHISNHLPGSVWIESCTDSLWRRNPSYSCKG